MRSVWFYFFLWCCVPLQGVALEFVPQSGHKGAIDSVAYSPDGKYIASSGEDGTVRLWELLSGKEIRTFSGHTLAVHSVRFSPDGLYLVSGSSDTIKLWEVASGKEIRSFSGHKDGITSLAISPDGRTLLSGSYDLKIKQWNISSGKEVRTFSAHKRKISSLAFSNDGSSFVSTSEDGKVILWDLKTGKPTTKIPLEALCATFSDDDKYIAIGATYDSLQVFEVKTGKLVRKFKGYSGYMLRYESVYSVFWGKDNKLISSNERGAVQIWDLRTGKELLSFETKEDDSAVRSMSLFMGNQTVAIGSNTVSVWSLESGKKLYSFDKKIDLLQGIAFVGKDRYLISYTDNIVKVWDLELAKQVKIYSARVEEVSPDGNSIVIVEEDFVKLLNPISGLEKISFKAKLQDSLDQICFSNSSRYLFIRPLNGNGFLFDLEKNKVLELHFDWFDYNFIKFSADEKSIILRHRLQGFVLVDVVTGKKIKEVQGHKDNLSGFDCSLDQKLCLSVSWDKTVKLWDATSFSEIRSVSSFPEVVRSVAFSYDSKLIALSLDKRKDIEIWDNKLEKKIATLTGHKDIVEGLKFSFDSKFLVSESYDGTVKVWNVVDHSLVDSYKKSYFINLDRLIFTKNVQYFAFLTNNKVILTNASNKKRLELLTNQSGEWLVYNQDGFFDCSPLGGEMVAAVEDGHGYSFEQIALKNNRPDIILKEMGLGNSALIEYYKNKYLKRLQKFNLKESDLADFSKDLPTVTIDKVTISKSGTEAELQFSIKDKHGIKWYQIFVNGVPLYKGVGESASGVSLQLNEKILLLEGENRIEISAVNVKGQESFRTISSVNSKVRLLKDLYFVGFGVSDYKNTKITDLEYADKDVKEFSETFSSLKGYQNFYKKIYTNQKATKESLKEVKEFIQKAKPQDTVVIFIAGHGLHDQDEFNTYYYLTYEADLEKLSSTAISFDEIESVLENTSSRQKMLFMDTCESGERDDDFEKSILQEAQNRGLEAKAMRGVVLSSQKSSLVSAQTKAEQKQLRAWLLERDRFIFQDLTRRSGAVVFSSSRGSEFSYESKKLENGLFTEAILSGILTEKADKDKNKEITREELKKYVIEEVSQLSIDLQHPTVDRDNPYLYISFFPETAEEKAIKENPSLAWHKDSIVAVDYSPDGKILATAGYDSTIKLWDTSSGEYIRTFASHPERVVSIDFSPDGKYIISGSWDKTIKLWDITSNTEIYTFTGHTNSVFSVVYSPDGQYIASGSSDNTVKIWDTNTKSQLYTLAGHKNTVDHLVFTNDHKLVSSSEDGTVKIWDAKTGKLKKTIPVTKEYSVTAICLSEDKKIVTSDYFSKSIKIWDITSGKLLKTIQTKLDTSFDSLSCHSDGQQVASGGLGTGIGVWNLSTGEEIYNIPFKGDYAFAQYSPDNLHLAIVTTAPSALIVNASTGEKEIKVSKITGPIKSLAFQKDGKTFFSAGKSGAITRWSVDASQKLSEIEAHDQDITSLAVSPDDKYLASASIDQTIKLWDITSGKLISTLSGHTNEIISILFSLDGKTIFSGAKDNTIKLWDINLKKEIKSISLEFEPSSMKVSPDKKNLLVNVPDSSKIIVFDFNLNLIKTIDIYGSLLTFTVDGKHLVTASPYSDEMKVYRADSLKQKSTLTGHTEGVLALECSPDGKYFASGSEDKTLKLWSTSFTREADTLGSFVGPVFSLAFSPDGKYLVAGSSENVVKLFDVASGALLRTYYSR